MFFFYFFFKEATRTKAHRFRIRLLSVTKSIPLPGAGIIHNTNTSSFLMIQLRIVFIYWSVHFGLIRRWSDRFQNEPYLRQGYGQARQKIKAVPEASGLVSLIGAALHPFNGPSRFEPVNNYWYRCEMVRPLSSRLAFPTNEFKAD